MKERFSAAGSQALWLQASKEALENAGFRDLKYDEATSTISGDLEGPLEVQVSTLEDGKTALEISSDSATDIDLYKQNVAKAFQMLQKKYPEEAKNEPLGGTPEDLRPNVSNQFKSAYTSTGEPQDLGSDDNIFVIPDNLLDEPSEGSLFDPDDFSDDFIIGDKGPNSVYDIPDSAHTTVIPETVSPSDTNKTSSTPSKPASNRPWYKTEWFTLLVMIILPPLGIFLMWHNNVYDKTLRKYITAFFCVYTLLWAWLLILPFLPRDTGVTDTETEATDLTAVEQVESYWNEPSVINFTEQMPGLMTTYENLYLNGTLYTDTGLDTARGILPQVQDLSKAVLSIEEIPSDSAAYPIYSKVRECAEAFNTVSALVLSQVNSADFTGLRESTNQWNEAESLFYEIDYTYQRTLQSAYVEDGLTPPEVVDNEQLILDLEAPTTDTTTPSTDTVVPDNTYTQPSTDYGQQEETTTETIVTEVIEETVTVN